MPPLVPVVVAWVVGLLAARGYLVPYGVRPLAVALLLLVPFGAMMLWRNDRPLFRGAACALALLLGALRYQISQPGLPCPEQVACYNDTGWVSAEGVISGYPDRRGSWTLIRIDVTQLEQDGQVHAVRGTALARIPPFPEVRYGDRVRIAGLLTTPPELTGFSYREYLARKAIYSTFERAWIERLAENQGSGFWARLYAARDGLRLSIARLMRAPESALLQGIVLGIRSEIPDELYEEFNVTSTSHVLVISGANVVIVTALLARAFGWVLGRRLGYWVTMAGLGAYILLVGAEVPVLRAGIMAGLYLTGRQLGRGTISYVSLCAAAFFITIFAPLSLWDTSFQLSFLATAGLVFLSEPFERLLDNHCWARVTGPRLQPVLRHLGEMASVTLAPQVMVLPLVATSFGRLSPVAPLANLLIAPVQPWIMAWGCASALLGLSAWLHPIARMLAWVPWLLLAYTRAVVHWMSGWPSASIPVADDTSLWLGRGIYGVLALLALVRRPVGWRTRFRSLAASRPGWPGFAAAAMALLLLGLTIGRLPDHRLHVHILDVGQGDAILITTPRGRQVLVDGGPSPTALFAALGKAMPFWDHSLDLVVATHADGDHTTGIVPLLERYDVGGWLDNGTEESSLLLQECLRRLEVSRIPRHIAVAGDRIILDEDISLEVVHPRSGRYSSGVTASNNNSVVLLLHHGANSFLLTGDIEAEAEHDLIHSARSLQADVLKVAHHGSGGSTTDEFLKAVDPAFAAISLGTDNRSGHPAAETLARLEGRRGILLLRTDLQGTLEFISDGRQLWIKTER